jgi:hypothetical protein
MAPTPRLAPLASSTSAVMQVHQKLEPRAAIHVCSRSAASVLFSSSTDPVSVTEDSVSTLLIFRIGEHNDNFSDLFLHLMPCESVSLHPNIVG